MQEIGRDSITLKLVKAIFECATEKIELAVIIYIIVLSFC